MIWFKCKQCGRTHGRGENLSGTTVFCECGTGNVVPWTSTTEAPPVEEAPLPAVPATNPRPAPTVEPVDDRDERRLPPRQEPPSRIPPRRVPLGSGGDVPRSEIPPPRPSERDYDQDRDRDRDRGRDRDRDYDRDRDRDRDRGRDRDYDRDRDRDRGRDRDYDRNRDYDRPRDRPPWRPAPRPRRADEDEDDAPPPDRGDLPVPSRRFLEGRRINPAFCLNHDETASTIACEACRQRFCAACVVTLEGKTLCGPCKNFRLRGLGRAAPVTAWAIIALIAALVSGPVAFGLNSYAFLSHVASTGSAGQTVVLALVALLPPGGSLFLCFYALRDIDRRPSAGGRALALTGAAAAGLAMLCIVSTAALLFVRQLTG
jgi:hypothetical protein